MKIGSSTILAALVCLAFAVTACSPAAATQSPDPSSNAQDTIAATETTAPSPSSAMATAVLVNQLSQADVLELVRASLAAFPWRLQQSVVLKQTGQTQTSLTEVQSSTRGYNRSMQPVANESVTIESILIDSLLYLKITGSPAETYGLVEGQWTQIPPGSPLAQLADTSAVDPAKIADIFAADFAAVSGQSGAGALTFELVGSEDLAGIATTIYESKGETFTYRWWIGADGRFYKTMVDIPAATRTILMEYDPAINIQPPIP